MDLTNINLVNVGVLLLGIGYLFTFWRQGGNKATIEVITALKEQHVINSNRIAELTHDLGVLTGQVEEKDKRIKLLEGLVKIDPEQELYMGEMRKFTAGVAEYMATSTKILNQISLYMGSINDANLVK